MKTKIFLAAVAAAAALVGCTKNRDAETVCDNSAETAELIVNIPLDGLKNDGLTKASGTVSRTDEEAVKSVQAFVFNNAGNLETYESANSGTLNLSCTRGDKIVAALVNAPAVSGITTLGELLDKTTALSDNAVGSFVMFGQMDVPVNEASVSVTLEVHRFASKVVIQKITNKMTLPQYQSSPVAVTGIYLINVAGDAPVSGSEAPSLWLNKKKNEASAENLYYEKLSSLNIAYNSSEEAEHYFYCYPNPTDADNTDEEWSPRHTRLVVEASVGGKKCYYPITLPVMSANTVYTIGELTLTRLGTETPDVETVLGSASFTITVAPWIAEEVGSVTI